MSLQHVPYDKDLEKSLPKEVMPRLSFAKQKVEEMVALAKSAKADKSKKLQLPAVGMHPPPGFVLQTPYFEVVQPAAAACLWHASTPVTRAASCLHSGRSPGRRPGSCMIAAGLLCPCHVVHMHNSCTSDYICWQQAHLQVPTLYR